MGIVGGGALPPGTKAFLLVTGHRGCHRFSILPREFKFDHNRSQTLWLSQITCRPIFCFFTNQSFKKAQLHIKGSCQKMIFSPPRSYHFWISFWTKSLLYLEEVGSGGLTPRSPIICIFHKCSWQLPKIKSLPLAGSGSEEGSVCKLRVYFM